jgi:L-asparaginase II
MKELRRAMARTPIHVHVTRGEREESEHAVHGVLVGRSTGTVAFGDADLRTFWRSAMKPFQVLPLVEDGAAEAFDLNDADIAVASGSHGGMPAHLQQVRSLLERAGLGQGGVDYLTCGPHPPFDEGARQAVLCAGESFSALHNNCSGKHAAMVVLAHHHGWPLTGYTEFAHPVQVRIREELRRWLDEEPENFPWARDGCSVPTPYISLRHMAGAYARLMETSADGESGPAAVVRSMTAHPDLTSSPGRTPLLLMAATDGRLLAKEGAEGVLCIGDTGGEWGLAIKVVDGATRATGPAALEALASRDLLTSEELDRLRDVRAPDLLNWQGARVGGIGAELRPADLEARAARGWKAG